MKQLNLNLGQKWDNPSVMPGDRMDEKHYPEFHYSGKEKIDVPHEGRMTIRYKKTSLTMTDNERSGKTYSCTFEVREIVGVESDDAEPPTKNNRETEDALDAIVSEKMKKGKY